LQPYLSNEIYWQLRPVSELSEDRVQLGASRPINRAATVNIFAMLDYTKADAAITPVIGGSLSFAF